MKKFRGKKILSICISIILLISLMPLSILAESDGTTVADDGDVTDKITNAEELIVDGTVYVDYGSDQDTITAAVQDYVNGILNNATVDVSGVSAIVYLSDDGENYYCVELFYGDECYQEIYIEMEVKIGEDPDIETIAAANTAVQSATYPDVAQGTNFDTKEELEAYITEIATAAINDSSVSVKVESKYTAAIAGSFEDNDGTNGSYVFTITVSKGSQSKTTLTMSIDINATAYYNYPIAEVNGLAVTTGVPIMTTLVNSAQAITFISDVDFEKFNELYCNGLMLTKNTHYSAQSGSIIITLLPEYVETLDVGTYEFTIACTDGMATFELVVVETTSVDSVATGDSTNVWLFLGLIIVCGLGIILMVVRRRSTK